MVGIYKITSPTKKVYIGQSVDIPTRFKTYRLGHSKKQIRLHRSLSKHGIENHIFEVVTECQEKELNNLERYYQDLYSAMGPNGLNCCLTQTDGQSGRKSEQTRSNISKSKIGYIQSEAHRLNNSKAKLGFKHTPEAKEKIRAAGIGRKLSEEVKRGISERMKRHVKTAKQIQVASDRLKGHTPWNKGVPMAADAKRKMIASKIGINTGESSHNNKIVLDTATGVYYFNSRDAAEFNNISYKLLSRYLTGQRRNKTSLIYA